jgi:hypothetical protein
MSNRRPLRPDPTNMFRRLDGARIPGGCNHCDAYQVIASPAYGHPSITRVNVHHDDWCPVLARHEANR